MLDATDPRPCFVPFAPALPPEQRPVISATRLKEIGGKNGCERKYAGHRLFGMKQSGSDALEFGSALHKLAEAYQLTGNVIVPESRIGAVLQAGAHYLEPPEPWAGGEALLIEHEHRGALPCGTPYVAFLDGGNTLAAVARVGEVLIQDLKTTSDPKWALDYLSLPEDLQALFYAWILLCDSGHWYAPRLDDGTVGPQQWRLWELPPEAQRAVFRWVYFASKGTPRSWLASDTDGALPSVSVEYVRRAFAVHIAPLVEKINAIHAWRAANPSATLDEIDRNPAACGGRGRWCGVGERRACAFENEGTPILIQLTEGPKKMTTLSTQDRLAALRARAAGATAPAPAPEPAPSPKAPEPVVAAAAAEPAPASTSVESAEAASEKTSDAGAAPESSEQPKRPRGRPRGTKAAPTETLGAGINPPEAAEALARLQEVPVAPAPVAAAAPTTCPSGTDLGALLQQLAAAVPPGVSLTVTFGGGK